MKRMDYEADGLMDMNPRIPASIKRLVRKLTAEAKKRGMSVVDLAKERGYFKEED